MAGSLAIMLAEFQYCVLLFRITYRRGFVPSSKYLSGFVVAFRA